MKWQILLARARMPLMLLAFLQIFLGGIVGIPSTARIVIFVVAYVVLLRAGTLKAEPLTVQAPVRGRWLAMNSPGTRVPSHGMQAYGQTYAIDLAHEPADGKRPRFGWWPLARRPDDFPGFGQPILAAADGVVVRAHSRERDHWSRNSWPAMVYLLVESVRELTGPNRVLGNNIVIDMGDGAYAVYAHLRRRSLRVRKGDRVQAGDHIADCGNSGNTTEPHLHFHLMDHPNPLVAAGLPVSFEHYETGGTSRSGMPSNNEAMTVP